MFPFQTVGQGQVHEPRHRGSHQTTEGGEGVDRGGATHQPLQDHSQRTTAKENQTGPPVISHLYLQTLIVAILRSCCNSVLHSLYVCSVAPHIKLLAIIHAYKTINAY